jgi:hypothetical protein
VIGASDAAVAQEARAPVEESSGPSPFIPLLIVVLGLAVATLWFVAIPAATEKPVAKRTCEVVFLKSGKTKCVKSPALGKQKAPRKA